MRADVGGGFVGRQAATGADLQAAQSAFAKRADRGGEAGTAVEPAVGGGAPTGTTARQPQPRNPGSGAELVAYLLAVDKSGKPTCNNPLFLIRVPSGRWIATGTKPSTPSKLLNLHFGR